MNVIQHAYGDKRVGDIKLDVYFEDGELIFQLIDYADPVDITTLKPRELDDIRPGGLGVHFIREVMDNVTMDKRPNGVGNVLEMRKRL